MGKKLLLAFCSLTILIFISVEISKVNGVLEADNTQTLVQSLSHGWGV
ncbi:putative membrane protein [Paenibacillus riograndensis SBR5]|uniref:Putative membrane protein n=1 Tax=Paenibacillus riograndensis SBR5 TaxID=1073571 RepID=A0A0E3WJF5_9BACL|nr:putative membrane protein [Paenibacillus riograndensis SBR5]